jgi:hypothetical protein
MFAANMFKKEQREKVFTHAVLYFSTYFCRQRERKVTVLTKIP